MASSLNKRDQCDVAIIGGGLAGSLSAIHLARAGFHIVLFEKDRRPVEKVCGEFLSYESLPLLREVGVDPLALGGVEITDVRLHGPTQTCEVRLPRRAVGISRTVLDEEMLRVASASGCDVRRGIRVTEILEGLDETTGSILVSTSAGETRASRLIVATGQGELLSLNERVGRDNSYVGFKMHVRLKPSCFSKLSGRRDLFAFDHGYGSLTDIGGGIADFCFVIKRSAVKSIGRDWNSLSAHIGKTNWSASHYLDGAEPLSPSFASIDVLPYGFLRRAPAPAGLFFVGDQMAVPPSMGGDGMTIALMTARRAVAAMIERLADGDIRLRFAPEASRDYQSSVRLVLRSQIESALAVHALFKNPRLIDMSTYAIRAFPAIFHRLFRTTRRHLIEAPNARARLSSRQKQARSPEIPSLGRV